MTSTTATVLSVLSVLIASVVVAYFFCKVSDDTLTLDEVMRNPAKFYNFDTHEWHTDIPELIDDEAYIAACEEVGPNSPEFTSVYNSRYDKLWEILDMRLELTSERLIVS